MPFHLALRRAPAITAVAVSAVEGRATVVPPTDGGFWATFDLLVCEKRNPSACLSGSPIICDVDVAAAAAKNATECRLSGLKASTTYTVVAAAYEADGTQSETSEPMEFTTPPHP